MNSDKFLKIALIASILIHGFILLQNSDFRFFSPSREAKELKVTYVEAKQQPKPLKVDNRVKPGFKRISPSLVQRQAMPKSVSSYNIKPPVFSRPKFFSPDITAVKKKITFPQIDVNKISNPSYVSYYQIVREKIRRAAYQNYTYDSTGEVYLSFVIASDGYIKDVRLVEEKSTANTFLQDIALRSVSDASPFSNFPKELDYPQLSFNIVISFEME